VRQRAIPHASMFQYLIDLNVPSTVPFARELYTTATQQLAKPVKPDDRLRAAATDPSWVSAITVAHQWRIPLHPSSGSLNTRVFDFAIISCASDSSCRTFDWSTGTTNLR
jgi:hypothetical protein